MINFDEIYGYIDLVLCHGGNGTLYQAINRGKRVIAIPTYFEQEWNANRFAGLGLCRVCYPETSFEEFLWIIEDVLSKEPDLRFKGRFSEISDKYRILINGARI